jgi:hypothetical protein
MRFKTIIYAALFLILINITFAQNIDIIKESPTEIKLNEVIEIKIHVYNPSSVEKGFGIIENLPQNIEIIEPKKTFTKMYDGLEIKYYNWEITVSPNSVKTIIYKIKPLSLGVYVITPTEVTSKSDNEILYGNPVTFNVKCIPDDKCDNGENKATCPEDCSTGTADGICDYIADGVCDPDCEKEPDCKGFNYNYLIIIFGLVIFIFILILIIPSLFG